MHFATFLIATQLATHCSCYLRAYQTAKASLTTHAFREAATGLVMHKDLVREKRVAPEVVHEVIFVVKQLNVDALGNILDDLSDPSSPNYGKHMTAAEINEITGNPTARDAVVSYLEGAGANVTSETLFGEYITARAPVSVWEGMFNTKFYSYAVQPMTKGVAMKPLSQVVRYIRSETYSVPIDLDEHVASVMNTVQMPTMNSNELKLTKPSSKSAVNALDFNVEDAGYISPASLAAAYHVDSSISHPRATQAVFEINSNVYSPGDLKTFQTTFNLPFTNVNTSVYNMSASVAYCNANIGLCGEGNLDVQYMMALSTSPTIYYYSNLGLSSDWLAMVASTPAPPKVISISYGCDESYVGSGELDAFAVQAMKLGLMGTTIVVSSGDDGAPGWYARSDPTQCRYTAIWPASCPYITSIGATMGLPGQTEIVCQSKLGSMITTGGGFSNYYGTPSWQMSAVSGYLTSVNNTSLAPVAGYRSTGRGYPDLALAGDNYLMFIGGGEYLGAGTSASAPVAGAIISLVNAARLTAGLPTVGWLNPILYRYHGSFTNDITVGKNNCTVLGCCQQGFSATMGWDPASGLGSLNSQKFRAFMMNINNITVPTDAPTAAPTTSPTFAPSNKPTRMPTFKPTTKPTPAPTTKPTTSPTSAPTKKPTTSPTNKPTAAPTSSPTFAPTASPSFKPSASPTGPTFSPTFAPSATPSFAPSASPTSMPTTQPTVVPTTAPTVMPTTQPTMMPTTAPTVTPTTQPTVVPTTAPTVMPTTEPTVVPTTAPTVLPSMMPTTQPTMMPTTAPTVVPTTAPTMMPTTSPTVMPTNTPTVTPTVVPTISPSFAPSAAPTVMPTVTPTAPTTKPTTKPTTSPTSAPTKKPTTSPTNKPTAAPTSSPTFAPTASPSFKPSVSPSFAPSFAPTLMPSAAPTLMPSAAPTVMPSAAPTVMPSAAPTVMPSAAPTVMPSAAPTVMPSAAPTVMPSAAPTVMPSAAPTVMPSAAPTVMPSAAPTVMPSDAPTVMPSAAPTVMPSAAPTVMPSAAPTGTPTSSPTFVPTAPPSFKPSATPTLIPSAAPTITPTSATPTSSPTTTKPTFSPSSTPSSLSPTAMPSLTPSAKPTAAPTIQPTVAPTTMPTASPTALSTSAPF